MRPYFVAALSHESAGNSRVVINNHTFNLPNNVTQGKYGLGGTLDIVEDISTYAEIHYQKGNKAKSPFNATIGVCVSC
ncbi:autotransporter outer membrane beta-barrel domain-containing protein [Citrobacter sp. JGM124]|nr:autotransporter outer membrane beta-barrel domain-containing protein [Citrobacter sp. JGM124]